MVGRVLLIAALSLQAPPYQVTPLTGVTLVGGEAAAPMVGEGAPMYSPEQLAGALCEVNSGGMAGFRQRDLQEAFNRTVDARNARRDFLQGRANQTQLERTELRRQAAVNRIGAASAGRAVGMAWDFLPIEGVTYSRRVEHGRPVLIVKGRMKNLSREEVDTPPLNLMAFDSRGLLLAGQTTLTGFETLGPGQEQAFEVKFRNPPEYTAKMGIGFAPPFQVRLFRGCDTLDPARFDPRTRQGEPVSAGPPPPAPKVGEGAPDYDAKELAAIARQAYDDAMDAFAATHLREEGSACRPLQSWRELLVLSEKADDAFVTTLAAQEVRRDAPRGVFTQAEVEAAELARQQAVRAVFAARPKSRSFTEQEMTYRISNAYTLPGMGDELIVRARMEGATNTVPMARVKVVDRFGFTVTDSLQPLRRTGLGGIDVRMRLPRQVVRQIEVSTACA